MLAYTHTKITNICHLLEFQLWVYLAYMLAYFVREEYLCLAITGFLNKIIYVKSLCNTDWIIFCWSRVDFTEVPLIFYWSIVDFFGEGNGNALQYFSWRFPWTEEPGGLQFIGSQEPDTIWQLNHHIVDLQCVHFCCAAKWLNYICVHI